MLTTVYLGFIGLNLESVWVACPVTCEHLLDFLVKDIFDNCKFKHFEITFHKGVTRYILNFNIGKV